ncbi:MAG: hydantoinase B/oxoprolinase family protein, partial [Pseudomonadota bacterium]
GYVGLASGKIMAGKGVQTVPAGQRLVIHTPGGGGHGDASDRAPDLLADDLVKGLIKDDR